MNFNKIFQTVLFNHVAIILKEQNYNSPDSIKLIQLYCGLGEIVKLIVNMKQFGIASISEDVLNSYINEVKEEDEQLKVHLEKSLNVNITPDWFPEES